MLIYGVMGNVELIYFGELGSLTRDVWFNISH